jgi:hypothetical protein
VADDLAHHLLDPSRRPRAVEVLIHPADGLALVDAERSVAACRPVWERRRGVDDRREPAPELFAVTARRRHDDQVHAVRCDVPPGEHVAQTVRPPEPRSAAGHDLAQPRLERGIHRLFDPLLPLRRQQTGELPHRVDDVHGVRCQRSQRPGGLDGRRPRQPFVGDDHGPGVAGPHLGAEPVPATDGRELLPASRQLPQVETGTEVVDLSVARQVDPAITQRRPVRPQV